MTLPSLRTALLRGVVTRARYVDDGSEVPAERLSMYPTVEGLFGGVERALARNAARLVVDYHHPLGYPERRAGDLIPVTELRVVP